MRRGVGREVTGAHGISTRSLAIMGMMATGTISADPASTAAAIMAVASDRAGRGHRSGQSGIAADWQSRLRSWRWLASVARMSEAKSGSLEWSRMSLRSSGLLAEGYT